MKVIKINQPRQFVFGDGCLRQCLSDLHDAGRKRLFVVTSPPLKRTFENFANLWQEKGGSVEIYDKIEKEPDIAAFEAARSSARKFEPDAVVGLGGGSALDVAKLVAAMADREDNVKDFFGINFLPHETFLFTACLRHPAPVAKYLPMPSCSMRTNPLKKGLSAPT